MVAALPLLAAGCARAVRAPASPVPPARPEPTPPPISMAPAPTTRQRLQGVLDSVLAAPMWRNARWGVLIVDPVAGDTLVSHDADRLFMPASNQKLLTGAIAVERLGPDYRWRTPLLLQGRQRGDRWVGTLLVAGGGDPTVSDALQGGDARRAFAPVVAALQARGIARITGDVATVGDAFPGATAGYGWAYDDFDEPYSAAVDELLFNEGVHTVWVWGGRRPGARVHVEQRPTAGYPPLLVRATTRARDAAGAPLQLAHDSTGTGLLLTGTVAAGDSARLTVAYRHPNDAWRAALRETLADAGIAVNGRAVARRDTAGRPIDTLVVLESAPLAQVLPRVQKPSQNQLAELLFRTSGLAASGSGSPDSARAVAQRTLAAWGVTAADAAYRDGSGLSRHDYVTPRAVVKVLDAMRRHAAFDLFRQALPLAGVDGTIANRLKGTAAEGNAQAKTGTLDKARALSGYVVAADGRLALFSLLANNFTVPNREVERVQDLLVRLLAELPLADAAAAGARGK
ncbi:MAG: D-alanyl-D-alanine carboxypeptidase/D-alanyl-D-alanine-endopeptidase [Gemmatimonadetes bacterium]|nr:D-alanyl-D-alanine carboxypeptidase/D-alanyl-D-alanine-endopeptidase [Gemmatimonadota bacterium]